MSFAPIADFALGEVEAPDSVFDFAATLLIDTLGVAAGAAEIQAGRLVRAHAARFHQAAGPEDSAVMIFDGRQASLPGAAFAAASMIDNLDAHDGYNPTKGHIGCAVVPALIALAEGQPTLKNRAALSAMIMAYELSARAALVLHATVSDYHTSGAWNALGVAALACRLRGQGTEVLRHALGIAEYHGPRSQMMREIANPTMLHDGSGMGALTGLMAALLAEDGFTGAPAITVEAPDIAEHWADLGRVWTTELNYIKPYPICRWAHGAIDAVAKLMAEHAPEPEAISRIEINTFAESAALFPGMPDTTSQAQYSLAFAVASQLVHGGIGPSEISGEALGNPQVARLVALTEVREEPRHSARFPAGRWSDLSLHLSSGEVLYSGDCNARGGPEAPLSLAEVESKFHRLAAPLTEARRQAIWQMRERLLDPDRPFAELVDLLKAPVEAPHV